MPARVTTSPTRFILIAIALASAGPAAAQNSVPARPLSGLDDFSLPSSRPPRAVPSPEPTISANPQPDTPPVVVATPAPRVRPTPAPRTAVMPKPGATPTVAAPRAVAPTPQPSAVPRTVPTPVPAPVASPTAQPTTPATVAPLPVETPLPEAAAAAAGAATSPMIVGPWQWVALLVAALVIGGAGASGYALWKRRRADHDPEHRDEHHHEVFHFGGEDEVVPAAPTAAPAPVAPPPPAAPFAAPVTVAPVREIAPAPVRASLDIELHIRRAGRNLLSAAVDYTIAIRNSGAVAATGIRLDIALLSAGHAQDSRIAALFAQDASAPAVAPFDLPAGASVELGGMAMQPMQSLERMDIGGRAMFVPVLTINLRYAWDGGTGQTARSYVIGIERSGAVKLQPFRLDTDPRMYDTVGAREYTVSVVL